MWFNNVETRPGVGYPRTYEDQDRWRGGWMRDKRGRLRLRDGGRLHKLLRIFSNPKLPTIDDYYEPWTYDYENLTSAPLGDTCPSAAPRSLISGKPMKVSWGPNWDDNLAGSPEIVPGDPVLKKVSEEVKLQARRDVHVLPAADLRALPQPVVRGVVPVGGDVQAQRGRHRAGRPGPLPRLADVCVRMPLQEGVFQPQDRQGREVHAVLSAHRGRPADGVLGDLRGAAALPGAGALRRRPGAAKRRRWRTTPICTRRSVEILLDPTDPEVIAGARAEGISDEWIEAAQRSPVYALINTYQVALPLHPEYRTMPMVWYIPPLSPVVDAVSRDGHDGEDLGNLFGALEALRIPMQYLAGLFTAGDTAVVEGVLRRLAAMRSYMRDINLGRETQPHIPHSVGMTEEQIYEMYRLLAIAKYEERYVIPTAYEAAGPLIWRSMGCSLSFEGGPGMYESGPFGEADGGPVPVAVETFHALQQRAGCGYRRPALVAGEPAELGRPRGAGRNVPRSRPQAMKLLQPIREPVLRDRLVWQAASLLLAYPDAQRDERLDTVERPAGRIWTGRRRSCWARTVARAACDRSDERRNRLRRDLRPAAPLHDVSDLLDGRRHPQPRPRDAGFAAAYRDAGVEPPDARRPTTCRWCWSSPRPSTPWSGGGC